MVANDYPKVFNGGPVDADAWFNPVAEDLTAAKATLVLASSALTNVKLFWSRSLSYSGATPGSYADIPGMNFSWTKNGAAADSDVFVAMVAGLRVSAVPTSVALGVRINGVDYDVDVFEQTADANAHFKLASFATVPGVGVGTYTVQGRIYRVAGTGTLNADSLDQHCILIGEILL